MTQISKEIFHTHQVRKTYKQKTAFIEFIKQHYPNAYVEEGGLMRSRNIIIGDIASAKAILTAHYDTCAVLPVPNFVTPKNMLFSFLYGFLLGLAMLIPCMILSSIAEMITHSFWVSYFALFGTLIVMFLLMLFGKANKHTANDNTSGVIQLCELMDRLGNEQMQNYAFVFFDNEEAGLVGSSFFKKKHKEIIANKLIINFDCVSDGNNIMFVLSKKAKEIYEQTLRDAVPPTDAKNVLVESNSTAFYPSDQKVFPLSIGVAALKKKFFIGYYLDRIHTSRDVIFDESNILFLCDGIINFIGRF